MKGHGHKENLDAFASSYRDLVTFQTAEDRGRGQGMVHAVQPSLLPAFSA